MALVVSSGNVGSHCPDADLPSFVTDVRGLGDVDGFMDVVKAPFKIAANIGKKAIGTAFGGARKALGAAIGGGGGGGGESSGGGSYMPAPVAPPASSFPVIPVVIGGVAVLGLTAFLLTRKKTPAAATAARARRKRS